MMDDCFSAIALNSELPADVAEALHDSGCVVIPGLLTKERLAQIADAYDAAVSNADPVDVGTGRTTTRVHDFVNRGPDFDELYVNNLILSACCGVIGRPFKLSNARKDCESAFSGAIAARGFSERGGWMADGRLHHHAG
jgi:hypothetical protein